MEFGVLGPVEIRIVGQVADAGHARQRAVLAVLLLDLGRVVPAEVLIDRVWGEQPPASGRNVLYGYVGRLRAILADAADPQVTLARRPGGYLLQAGAEQVDLCRFRALAAQAAAAGDDQRAAALLRQALGLWRGPALAGLDSPWLDRMRDTLELERAAAELELTDIRLRQGQHGALAGELAGQAAGRPADERLTGQLMLALYRSGRQAEALRWFEQTRQHLAEELGADPSPQLQALHQQILRADPALTLPERGSGARPAVQVPRQLPANVAAFTGRAAELAELDQLLLTGAAATARTAGPSRSSGTVNADGRSTAAVISAVSGTPGVGKTALAVHWAHHAASHFADGQLYVNLRGYDPDRPVPAADALAGFLRSLGVPGQDIPAEEDERAARYRSLLAGKRMLIVLDNASEVAQVRPLLPGTPACVVLVTSRDSLAGLVARDGARRLELDLLPLADAISLLRALVGRRVDDGPAAAKTLAVQCCRQPLALRVAAELAAARPDVPLAELADELADQQKRLDLLDAAGDPRTAVRAVFSWSYRHLDPGTARAFRLLGLHPGNDFDPYAATALTGTSLDDARRMTDVLARAHLIQPAGPGRYGMHDLLRAYARELAARDGQEQQDEALTRLFDHFLHTASIAMDTLHPAERHRRPRIPRPATPTPPVNGSAAARAWLGAERAALVAVIAHAAGHGWPAHATRLAATLFRHLDAGGHYSEAMTIHSQARVAARRAGDRAAEGTALNDLAGVYWRLSRYQEAAGHLQQALALFRQAGDRTGQARPLTNLGRICRAQGRYQEGTDFHRQALALFQEAGDLAGEATALNGLGDNEQRQGRYDLAARHHRQALAIAADIGDRGKESDALVNLGAVGLRQGRYQQADGYLHRARDLYHELGHRDGEAEALTRIGDVCLRQGHPEEATRHLREALALYREIGNRSGEADALDSLGEVLLTNGQPRDARSEYAAALRLATQADDKYQQARAHHGLGEAYRVGGDPGEARRHWQHALALFTELGTPEAGQVRARLAATDDDSQREREPSR